MSLDGLVTYALVGELQQLVGGRIHKIHQPSAHDIVMQIRNKGRTVKLLLSANPTYPRIHLTEQSYINPLEAPMFCMLLRKHCENGTLASVEQVGLERIVRLRVAHRDELGDERTKTIVVELTGRHSNIILLDHETGVVLDGIHHVTPAISSHRIVMPGSAYTPPPEQHKADPLSASAGDVAAALEQAGDGDTFAQRLVAAYSGIGPLSAREIVWRAGEGADAAAVAAAFAQTVGELKSGNAQPNIAAPSDGSPGKPQFSVIALTHVAGERTDYPGVSACLEAFYAGKAERDAVKQRAADLLKLLANERAKNETKLLKQQAAIDEAQEADRYRIMGELLTASLHQVAKGDAALETINYYDESQPAVRIQLDPLLSPSENAQRYFKKYAKLKKSVAAIKQQMQAAGEEIDYLDRLLQQLDDASLADIEEIREELIEQGYVRRRGKPPKHNKKNNRPSLVRYTSSEGAAMYVGKNNTQNEYLTCRLAAPNDTWLHTKDIPGSHVVIRGSEFGEATLHEAAMLSAYFSKAKQSSQVPVDYTLVRHVRKPNGAKPGYVIYERQKTLFVTPDEQRIKALPSRID